jgi:hypothetical protein
MLRIQRDKQEGFAVSGRLGADNLAQLGELFKPQAEDRRPVSDLKDLTFVDRETVLFLADREDGGRDAQELPAIPTPC